MDRPPPPDPGNPPGRLRAGWLLLGLACLALGGIGAIVPLMPTTIFLILAAACFARSSPGLEARLLDHPRVGPTIRAWRETGAISRSAKRAACIGIAAGFTLFCLAVRPGWPLGAAVAAAMLGCALWILSRPMPETDLKNGAAGED